MNSINLPNKTFVVDKTYDHFFGRSTQFIVIAASDKETACEHIKEKLGFDLNPNELLWLIDVDYKTIYDQNGMFPAKKQARILYNSSVHYNE